MAERGGEVAGLCVLVEQAPDSMFVADPDGRLSDVNEAGCRLLDYAHDELVGKTIADLIPAEDQPGLKQALAPLLAGQAQTAELRLRHKDGHLIPVEVSARLLPDGRWQGIVRDITRRKLVEHELHERLDSERSYREIFDNSMDAALLTAPDGRVMMANAAAVALFGFSEAELSMLGRAALVDEADPQLVAALEERARTGRFRGELMMKRKDGTRFPAEISSSIFRDEAGAEWTSMFIRDVSERRALEHARARLTEEVDARRRWLEAVLAAVPAGVVLFDAGGTMSVNQRTEELLGMRISPSGGSAQYANRILYPDGTPVPRERLVSSRVLARGETVLGEEFLVEHPDGTRIPVLGSAAPIRGSDGSIVGAVGVFQDVSERMRIGERIRAKEQLLSTVFESVPVGLCIADREGRCVRANQAALRIWAGTLASAADLARIEARWADSGQRVEPDEWPLTRALTAGDKVVGKVLRIRAFDGIERVIVQSAVPLYDEQRAIAGAILVDEDITELKVTEGALRRAVQARDDILGIVAHDLRNPLNAVLLQSQLLTAEPDPHGHARGERIRKAAMRMDHLIEDLLDIVRIDSGSLRIRRAPVEVAALLADIEETQRPLAIQVGVELAIDAVPASAVWGDEERLAQVLENLVGNALKFTPAGGRVRVGACVKDDSVQFWVADTGPGIAAEHCAHVFDRFWQGPDTARRGAGLGLAIARGIVEAHGGHIWVDSRVGEGAAFYFEVPSVRVSATEPAESHPTGA